MANTKTAKKRVKTIATRTLRNKAYRSDLRTAVKKAQVSLEANATDKADVVRTALSKLDRAAGKRILHKNTAARKKSQLARRLNQANA